MSEPFKFDLPDLPGSPPCLRLHGWINPRKDSINAKSTQDLFRKLKKMEKKKIALRFQDTSINEDEGKYVITVQLPMYKYEDIKIKSEGENIITLAAFHETREDEFGYISREFSRQFVIPDEYDVDRLKGFFSLAGVLTLTFPKIDEDKSKVEEAG